MVGDEQSSSRSHPVANGAKEIAQDDAGEQNNRSILHPPHVNQIGHPSIEDENQQGRNAQNRQPPRGKAGLFDSLLRGVLAHAAAFAYGGVQTLGGILKTESSQSGSYPIADGGEAIDYPVEYVPLLESEQKASEAAAEVLAETADPERCPTVKHVLDRVRGERPQRGVSATDYVRTLRHTDGALVLVTWSNLGVEHFGYDPDADTVLLWGYSAIEDEQWADQLDYDAAVDLLEAKDPDVILFERSQLAEPTGGNSMASQASGECPSARGVFQTARTVCATIPNDHES